MRYFLTTRCPETSRILVVESGGRHLIEGFIPHLRLEHGPEIPIDLVTCYAGLPAGLDEGSGTVYRVSDYRGRVGRRQLFRKLLASRPSVLVIICSGEPIMTKWKWAIAALLPSKVRVLNENGDFFWLDRGHWRIIRHFVLFRAGLSGGDAVRTLLRVALFPLTVTYLLLYAAIIHLRRKVHG
jgi:hypothetical protein